MRASSWMPGTVLVIGVRFGGLGEMTERSVCGVNAKAREGRGQGIVGGCGGEVVCGEVGALQAIGVGYLLSEPDEKLVAPGRGRR